VTIRRCRWPVAPATIAAGTLPLIFFVFATTAGGPYNTKLPADRQIVHVLNRLTFGPRPGDVEEVRRVGLEKWIDLQLHSERIAENKTLEVRLKPLETLRMPPAQITKEYTQAQMQIVMMNQPFNVMNNLPQEVRRQINNGTAEERKAALGALDEDKRKQVLLTLPPTNLASIPEYQKEAEDFRKAQQDERQQEMRRRNPPLADLLTPAQITTATHGTADQLKELFASLDPDKLKLVAAALPPQALAEFPELRREGMRQRQPQQIPVSDYKAERLFSAVYSDRQLEEVLVDFWLNHFSVYENKNLQMPNNPYRALFASYEHDAIRPHVLGHFKDLLLATARHPAMLYYLDNWESMSPDSRDRIQVGPLALGFNLPPGIGGPRQDHGLNENYGRELMELHTLGVGGGYTQQDVIEVARCFTGWTVRKPDDPEFAFVDFIHDQGEKTVLGHKIAANGGEKDGLQVIDILAHHPSTAHFISRQLAQRFVADDPPESLVTRMAQTFQKTDGDLRAVLQTMFSSTGFLSEGAWEAKIKSPFEMVVSAVRAAGADAVDSTVLVQKVADLGEPLYGRVEPNGYPLTGDGWLGTADLLGRMSFAAALVSGKIPGVHPDASRWEGKDAATIARDLLGRDAAPETLEVLKGLQGAQTDPRTLAGFIIGSPEFNRR
jgi:uncharacterized protein (DUF1800 family)